MPSVTESPQPVSLLWPHGVGKRAFHADTCHVGDLSLDRIVDMISFNGRHRDSIRAIFLDLCDDPVILRYRGDILENLLASPELVAGLELALPLLLDLTSYTQFKGAQDTPFHQTILRLGELDIYIDTVQTLLAGLSRAPLAAEGLCTLRDDLARAADNPLFGELVKALPELNARIRGLASVTIGVNLDAQLRPIEATLLSVNTEKFKDGSLIDRLLGKKSEFQGVGPLHSVPVKLSYVGDSTSAPRENPLLFPLFRDLDKVLTEIVKPIAIALTHYARVNTRPLIRLEPEIIFYIGAVRLINLLKASGLPACRPEIAPVDERCCTLKDLVNVTLALRLIGGQPDLRTTIVPNDVSFDDAGRIFIVTGPNLGGKTTFTQAVGIAQVMMQAGLYVPTSSARMSPVDGLFSHFPVEERPDMEAGRLGEESQRLHAIFSAATRFSLVLLNESLSSTSAGESLYLAQDIVRSLRLLGARAVFATHLHELAERIDAINRDTPGDSAVASLVSVVTHDDSSQERVRRTYKIIASPPRGVSYAREIASRFGISFEQIAQTLRDRGVVK